MEFTVVGLPPPIPLFIAVQTPHCHIPGYAVDHHVAYLAFDSTKVRVDSASGFMRVPQALQFLYLPLNGVEIAIGGLLPGLPLAGPSYAKVVRKDDYWPEEVVAAAFFQRA